MTDKIDCEACLEFNQTCDDCTEEMCDRILNSVYCPKCKKGIDFYHDTPWDDKGRPILECDACGIIFKASWDRGIDQISLIIGQYDPNINRWNLYVMFERYNDDSLEFEDAEIEWFGENYPSIIERVENNGKN